MKKALAGPARRTAKKRTAKKPERRAMIAAVGRWTRKVDRRLDRLLGEAPGGLANGTRGADRKLDRVLDRARPRVGRWTRTVERRASKRWRKVKPVLLRGRRRIGKRLRPVGAFLLRAVAAGERLVRRAAAGISRTAQRIHHAMPVKRVALVLVAASALALVVSQFIEYRAVEIGQPGYAGLPTARAPTVDAKTAGRGPLLPAAPIGAARRRPGAERDPQPSAETIRSSPRSDRSGRTRRSYAHRPARRTR